MPYAVAGRGREDSLGAGTDYRMMICPQQATGHGRVFFTSSRLSGELCVVAFDVTHLRL